MVAQISKNKKLKKKKSENYIFFQETFTKKKDISFFYIKCCETI